MIAEGSCHCGKVRITVELPEPLYPHRCNCSICARKGGVMIDVSESAVIVSAGAEWLGTYTFNTGVAKHRFCRECGIHIYHHLRSEPDKVAINGACFPGLGHFDFDAIPVHDGANAHPRDTGKPNRIAGIVRYEPTRS